MRKLKYIGKAEEKAYMYTAVCLYIMYVYIDKCAGIFLYYKYIGTWYVHVMYQTTTSYILFS